MVKISVIVPVYNVENELERCVKSICSQTYRNLEIIFIVLGKQQAFPNRFLPLSAYLQISSYEPV